MKKSILLIVVILTISIGTAFGQIAHFGIKGGVNFTNLAGDGLTGFEADNITTYHAGVFVEFIATSQFSIQPELLYSLQGSNLTGEEDIEYRLGYISIPVLARYYFIPDILSVDLGPQFSILQKETDLINSTASDTYEVALAGGVTANVLGPIFLQARYVLGLTQVRPDARNSVIQLSAGVRF